MIKMTDYPFVNSDDVTIEANHIQGCDDALRDLAIKRANQRVKSLIPGSDNLEDNVPEDVSDAGTLFAIAKIRDIVFGTYEGKRDPIAQSNESDALELLKPYTQ